LRARLIEAEDGEQIVVFPPGFEIAADEVLLTKDGLRVILSPVAPDAQTDLES
jgi:virulence-associated protein VagC